MATGESPADRGGPASRQVLTDAEAGQSIEASNVCITPAQLTALLRPNPNRSGQLSIRAATFAGARFTEDASFAEVTFTGPVDFAGATFEGQASFAGATFEAAVSFARTTFEADVDFTGVLFKAETNFEAASFLGSGAFAGAVASDMATYTAARFVGIVDFSSTTFHHTVLFDSCKFVSTAAFGGAVFSQTDGTARFDWSVFRDNVHFGGALFNGTAVFDRADLGRSHADFLGAIFAGDSFFVGAGLGAADFSGGVFRGDAYFVGASFRAEAVFGGSSFEAAADFYGAGFSGHAYFPSATFAGPAYFDHVTFGDGASFEMATFGDSIAFDESTVAERLDFKQARFDDQIALGPLVVRDTLMLERAVFAKHARMEVSTPRLLMRAAELQGGCELFARYADVDLDDAIFGHASLIAVLRPTEFLARHEAVWAPDLDPSTRAPTLRILSMRGARVAGLSCVGLDFRACRFVRARGLDGLHLVRPWFAEPPAGIRRISWRVVRLTRRQAIAEEHHWRAHHGHGADWYVGPAIAPSWLRDTRDPPTAEQVAVIYRMLRKSREDSRDAPGAADFYYGEMELRRHYSGEAGVATAGRRMPRVERWILDLYWLVSGYGLRASRAFVALAVTLAVATLVLHHGGFCSERTYAATLLFATESSISLLRAPSTCLTEVGDMTTIVLRLAGPLFFGLAILSLRGRVTR